MNVDVNQQKKPINKIVLCVIVVLVLTIIGVPFYMRNINTPKTILKTAVKEKDISERNYVLCKRTVTTGFDWYIVKDENGNKNTYEHCNIINANPFNELNLDADFIFSDNTYVFYFDEKNTYYSEEMSMEMIEYFVTDWDILYPVKHGFPNFFSSKKYITTGDVRTDTPNQ